MPLKRPRLKLIRRLGTPLPGLTRKEPKERPAPGRAPRRRTSPYAARLREKQKVRFHYGVSERQLRGYLERARRRPGATGVNLLGLLERRLDNVVFRLGLAPTIPAARQLVAHGHMRVNGRRVDRPAFETLPGDRIAAGPRARNMAAVQDAAAGEPEVRLPGYLARDPDDACAGRVLGTPGREDVPFIVNEAAIVEFYAR